MRTEGRNSDMQKKVTARHFDLTPKIREKAESEMESLKRYFDNIISAEMILDQERHRRLAELRIHVYNNTITGTAATDNLFSSIDAAVQKVKVQLKKYKSKLKDKNPEEITDLTSSVTRPETDVDAVE